MRMSRFGLATAALAATACLSAPAFAADLYGGSIKDAPVCGEQPRPLLYPRRRRLFLVARSGREVDRDGSGPARRSASSSPTPSRA